MCIIEAINELPNILEVTALLVSLVALLLSSSIAVASWHRSRSTYGIEEFVIRKIDGSRDDASDRGYNNINQKLSSGKYTILTTYNRKDGDIAIIIARIKKTRLAKKDAQQPK